MHFTLHRYYRANAVRYPTPACEGVCALNHYCAITRVDYREFRQCLETAASALASSSKSSGSTISRLTLLLSVFATIGKSPQRRLLIGWLHHLAFGVPRAAVTPLIQSLTRFAMLVVQCLVWVWLYWTTTSTAPPSIPSTPSGLAIAVDSAVVLIALRKSRRCTDVSFYQHVVHPLNLSYRILINPDKVWNSATTIADGRCEVNSLIAVVVVIGNDDVADAERIWPHNNPSIAMAAVEGGGENAPTSTWTRQMLLLFMLLPEVSTAKESANTMHIICQSAGVNSPNATKSTRTTNCCRQTRSTTTISHPAST